MTDATSQPEPVDPGHEPGVDPPPEVDPTDAGFPASPELDDDNTVVTPPNADDEPGSAAG
jgi:hypothetical protein